jgi:4-diphosphocytidyl-2C-methyl-D-erythritol kinase
MNSAPLPVNPAMRLLAPAKINLHLRVGSPTPDGFHPLLSWMCAVSLFDTLTLSRAEPDTDSPLIQLSSDDPGLPCDATNLIVRCGHVLADAIAAQRGVTHDTREGGDVSVRASDSFRGNEGTLGSVGLFAIRAALQKRIPMGAGLGGGSSDGAIAMMGLNRLWVAGLGPDELAELAARCGSDLPFFFHGPSSICTGRGQIVKPTPPPVARWGVLMLPKIAMPTPAVYRKFDELRLGDARSLVQPPDWIAWAKLPAQELLPRLVNDLETPAFAICPELGSLRKEIESRLSQPVRMSGSGSSLFTLFNDRPSAQEAAEMIAMQQDVTAPVVQLAPAIDDGLNVTPEVL